MKSSNSHVQQGSILNPSEDERTNRTMRSISRISRQREQRKTKGRDKTRRKRKDFNNSIKTKRLTHFRLRKMEAQLSVIKKPP
jgi:hypothetical protein